MYWYAEAQKYTECRRLKLELKIRVGRWASGRKEEKETAGYRGSWGEEQRELSLCKWRLRSDSCVTFSFFPKVQSSLCENFLPVAVFAVLSFKVEPSQSFQLENYGDDFRPATPPGLQFWILELWQYFFL